MKKVLLLAACWLFMAAAHAVVPESGLWAIDAENNGQPGRGFELDLQGSTLVLTFYGYNGDGSAQWYLAAGTLTGEDFSGTLLKYAGGMAFGGAQVAARDNGNAGSVSMHFADARHGTITLPGEPAKAMSRLNFARPTDPNSLTGSYTLERAVIYLASPNAVFDSQVNMTASGTTRISGNSISQSVSVTINGSPGSMVLGGTLTDQGAYAQLVMTSGATGYMYFVKRGDELITFVASSSGTEVDYWRRVSASPTAAMSLSSPGTAGDVATPGAPALGAVLRATAAAR